MNDRPGYPWSEGDVVFASELNAAISNAGGGGGMRVTDWLPPGQPDGTTANHVQIQAAIDAAAGVVGGDRAAAPGLTTIRIPATAHPYIIGASLMVPSNSHIVVEHGAVLQQQTSSPCTFFRCTPLPPSTGPISNVLIELYGTLDGQWITDPSIPTTPPGTYQPPFGVGIGGGPCANVYVRSNRQGLIKNIKNGGLNLTSATNCKVSGVTFDTCGDSVGFAGITTVVALGVTGTYNSTTGAASLTTDVAHGIPVGGVFTLMPPAGVSTTATAAVLAGNTVIPVASATGIVVGNLVYVSGTGVGSPLGLVPGTIVVSISGLNITIAPATINDGVPIGATVRFSPTGAVNAISGTFTATAGTGGTTLNFTANKAIGSYLFSGNRVGTLQGCSNVTLSDCVIRNVHDFGACLYGGVVGGAVRDCEITRCKATGVATASDSGQAGLNENCEISGNFIHDNFSAGVLVAGLQAGTHPRSSIVTNNRIVRNGKAGIAASTCDSIDISDNHLESNTYGWVLPPSGVSGEIAVQSSAIRASIRDNTILNPQVGGTIQTVTIVSGTYNATTGEVRLVTNIPLVVNSLTGQTVDAGNIVVVSGLTGTGSFTTLAAFNGQQTATDSIAVDGNGNPVEQTGGTVIYFVDTPGMAAATITGGTVNNLRGYGIAVNQAAYLQMSGNRIGDYQPTQSMQACIGGVWGVHGLSEGNYFGPRISANADESVYGTSYQGLSYDTTNGNWLGSGTYSGSIAFAVAPTAPTLPPGTNTTQVATTAFVQAATSSSFIYTATGGTTPRSAQDRATEPYSVRDFGAVLDGVTDDSAAFAAARAAARAQSSGTGGGGVVKATPGIKLVGTAPTFSAPAVLWKIDGMTFPGGTLPVTNIVTGDPVESYFNAGKYFRRGDPASVANPTPVLRVDYSGHGNSNGAIWCNFTQANNGTAFGWGIVSSMQLTQTGNGQPVALAAVINRTTGATPAYSLFTQINDKTGLPPQQSSQSVGYELDLINNGPDIAGSYYSPRVGSRAGIHFVANAYDPGAWVPSHAYAAPNIIRPTTANGFIYILQTPGTSGSVEPTWPTSAGTVTDGTCVWAFGTTAATQISRGIQFSALAGASYGTAILAEDTYYDAVIEMSTVTLDLATNPNAAAIRLGANLPIDWSGNGTSTGQNLRTTGYNSSTTRWSYTLSGVEYLAVADNGSVITGKGSAGATADTGGHLLIPFCAGAPTGVPANAPRGIALRYDTTAHKLWAYDNGTSAWRGVALT